MRKWIIGVSILSALGTILLVRRRKKKNPPAEES